MRKFTNSAALFLNYNVNEFRMLSIEFQFEPTINFTSSSGTSAPKMSGEACSKSDEAIAKSEWEHSASQKTAQLS